LNDGAWRIDDFSATDLAQDIIQFLFLLVFEKQQLHNFYPLMRVLYKAPAMPAIVTKLKYVIMDLCIALASLLKS
jgi:hypothetical protein